MEQPFVNAKLARFIVTNGDNKLTFKWFFKRFWDRARCKPPLLFALLCHFQLKVDILNKLLNYSMKLVARYHKIWYRDEKRVFMAKRHFSWFRILGLHKDKALWYKISCSLLKLSGKGFIFMFKQYLH